MPSRRLLPQKFLNRRFRHMGQKSTKIIRYPAAGFLRGPLVNRFRKAISHELFRRGILRHAPAVLFAALIGEIYEIADNAIALRLQAVHGSVETFPSAPAVVPQFLEPFRHYRRVGVNQFKQGFVLKRRDAVVETGVEVVSVPAEVGKVRKPFRADKRRFFLEKLPVGAPGSPNDGAFPFVE